MSINEQSGSVMELRSSLGLMPDSDLGPISFFRAIPVSPGLIVASPTGVRLVAPSWFALSVAGPDGVTAPALPPTSDYLLNWLIFESYADIIDYRCSFAGLATCYIVYNSTSFVLSLEAGALLV